MKQAVSKTLRYALLPEIFPRVRDLLGSGFGFVAYSIACVFQTAGLLPRNHAYTNPVNIGRFGIRHVLGQAGSNLRFTRNHIDQVILYGMILLGCVLLLIQFSLMGFALFTQNANATGAPLPTTFAGFFVSPNPTQDISYILLDRIFGIPDLFGSCVSQQVACLPGPHNPNPLIDGAFPQPYHLALQELLGFYSYGLLLVAAIIFVYYIITILAEMSETGTAFGRRFNRAWAPLRMIIAFGLLVPMTYNLNAAQYITLYAAKWGSGFATNSWNFFITRMALTDERTLVGDRAIMVSKPQPPSSSELLQFMSTASTCKIAYKKMYDIDIDAYVVRVSPTNNQADGAATLTSQMGQASPYYDLQAWFALGDVEVVFGERSQTKYPDERGYVFPTCGSLTLSSLRVVRPEAPPFEDGADRIPYNYLSQLVLIPWEGGAVADSGLTFVDIGDIITNRTLPLYKDMSRPMPGETEKNEIYAWYSTTIMQILNEGWADMRDNADWAFTAMEYGWGGAGIWYNQIARINGEFADAAANLPIVTNYPIVMNKIKEERSKANALIAGTSQFDPHLSNGDDLSKGMNERDKAILQSLNKVYDLWDAFYEETKPKNTGNAIVDSINALFRKVGLWNMRDNEAIHPLANFATMGKALLMHSVIAFGGGAVTGAAGAMSLLGGPDMLKTVASNMTSFMISIGYMGMATGFMLYYIVPLMPFVYFFFAMVGWAKTLFEAMVGVPLWALAHLRYDGDGFPTRQSLYGYYLLLDIFLRPVLIVFGLIGSMAIFYALARTLNNVFDTVTSNLTGFDHPASTAGGGPAVTQVGSVAFYRGAIDQFFFTIIYTVIVYMMGTSCFKLIDLFPNNILRWFGSSAQGFSATHGEDAGAEMGQKMKSGTYQMSDQVGNMSSSIISRTGGADYEAPQVT
jgi:hypothetical protein